MAKTKHSPCRQLVVGGKPTCERGVEALMAHLAHLASPLDQASVSSLGPSGDQSKALGKIGYRLPFRECPQCEARQVIQLYADVHRLDESGLRFTQWCYECGWKNSWPVEEMIERYKKETTRNATHTNPPVELVERVKAEVAAMSEEEIRVLLLKYKGRRQK